MDEWLSHTVTGVIGVIAGTVPGFLLRRRQQTSDEWQSIVVRQGERIGVLEGQIEGLRHEHVQCLQIQGELKAEIGYLKRMLEKSGVHSPPPPPPSPGGPNHGQRG